MKHDYKYHSPTIEIIAVDAESVLCASMVFGNEGGPGKDYFDENDIKEISAKIKNNFCENCISKSDCLFFTDTNHTKNIYNFVHENKLEHKITLAGAVYDEKILCSYF